MSKASVKRFCQLLAVVVVVASGITSCSQFYLIGINTSSSLPGVFFLVYRGQVPDTDDIIAFRAPDTRFYQKRMFLKLVKGKGGDVLSWQGRTMLINDQVIGVAKVKSKTGVSLHPTPGTTIGDNEFFTWTPHPDSFDSRYKDIGLIDSSRVVGRAVRIL